jgi:HlyD family secretion protein
MPKHFRHLSSAILLVMLVGLVSGCQTKAGNEPSGEAEVVAVTRGSLVTSITAVGSIRPGAEVMVAFQASGQVTQVLVQAGDQVVKGQPLARLDTADLELQVRSAKAALASAQAQLDQIVAGPKEEEILVARGQLASAQASLDQAIAQRDQLTIGTQDTDIIVAQTQLVSAQARVKQLQFQVSQTRAQDPQPDVVVAEVQLERAKIALDETQDEYNKALDRPWEDQEIRDSWTKQLRQAKLDYRQMQAQFDRAVNTQKSHTYSLEILAAQIEEALSSQEAAQAQLEQAQNTLEPRIRAAEAAVSAAQAQRDIAQAQLDMLMAGATEAEIAIAQASVDQAQVTLDSAELALQRTTLTAPFDGVVARLEIDVGKFVSQQVPALTLVNDRLFSIEADVDEADIGWLKVGQDVEITLDAFPGQDLIGQVTAILPSATESVGVVAYRVTITIAPTDLQLRSGMTANTEIVRERRDDVLLVPNRAIWIDSDTGRPFVEKARGDDIVVAFIEQGLTNDEFSEVLDGLQEGEELLVRADSIRDRFRSVVTTSMTGQ